MAVSFPSTFMDSRNCCTRPVGGSDATVRSLSRVLLLSMHGDACSSLVLLLEVGVELDDDVDESDSDVCDVLSASETVTSCLM